MQRLLLIALLALAVPALASTYFPLVPGAAWTLADDDPATTMTLTLAGEVMFHGAPCYPRYENVDGVLTGISYWNVDAEGRVLLHGLEYLVGDALEFYFSPPAVFLDPDLACGEIVDNTVNVYEVQDVGDFWWEERTVRLTCVDRDPVTTPLGTFSAVTVDPAWIDSPDGAPWRYGQDGVFSYGFGIGPVRIASQAGPEEYILVELENLVPTDTPAAVVSEIDLRAAPNPFNPATVLRFSLAAGGPARLEVFDLAGRRVAVLHDGPLPAGRHEFAWQPRELGSGVYLARVSTLQGAGTTRLTLVE